MTLRKCLRCKSHVVKEIIESEVFGVSKNRGHVYNAIHKGLNDNEKKPKIKRRIGKVRLS